MCVMKPCKPLTHGRGENNNPQHIHAFAGTRRCFHDDVRWRREIQGEVLDVSAVVILDAVDVDPTGGGLIQELSHCWFGDEFWDSLGSILETEREYRSSVNMMGTNQQQRKQHSHMIMTHMGLFIDSTGATL